jgi:hypothetical protein
MRSLTDTQRETLGLVSGSSLVRGFYLAGNKWACQGGLILRDTGVDLAVKRNGKLYNAIIGECSG